MSEVEFKPSVTQRVQVYPLGLRAMRADRPLALQKNPLENTFHSSKGLVYITIIITGGSEAYQSFKKGAVIRWRFFILLVN